MVATVVSVVIFLSGVFVGRGVRLERAARSAEARRDRAGHHSRPGSRRAKPPPAAGLGSDRRAAAARRRRAQLFQPAREAGTARGRAEAGPEGAQRKPPRAADGLPVDGGEIRADRRRRANPAAVARPPRRRPAAKASAPAPAGRRRSTRLAEPSGSGFRAADRRAQRTQSRPRRSPKRLVVERLCRVRADAGQRHAVGLSRAHRQVQDASRGGSDRGQAAKRRAVQALDYALALASGALLALSFPKFGHPAFGWIALAPLLVALPTSRASLARAFALGLTTGVVYFTGTLYWITRVMAVYGGPADLGGGARQRPADRLPRALSRRCSPSSCAGSLIAYGAARAAWRRRWSGWRPSWAARYLLQRLSLGAARLQPGDHAADRAARQRLRRVRRVGARRQRQRRRRDPRWPHRSRPGSRARPSDRVARRPARGRRVWGSRRACRAPS